VRDKDAEDDLYRDTKSLSIKSEPNHALRSSQVIFRDLFAVIFEIGSMYIKVICSRLALGDSYTIYLIS
jgi:hypothetical protein